MMKKLIRVGALLLVAALLLCSCKKMDFAIKVGDQVVSENDYARQVETLSAYLSSMNQGTLSDPEEFKQAVCDHLIDLKLFAQKFDELNLSFTAEEQEKIDEYLAEVISTYESMSAFQQALTEAGYTYEEYVQEVSDYEKKAKVLDYYFGPEGKEPVAVQDLKDYYAFHNALIKYVAISTVDSQTNEPFDEAGLAEAKKKAEEAFNEATRTPEKEGEDYFADVIRIYSEDTSTAESPMVINNEGVSEDSLNTKVMEMKIGEVILVELDEGYMIVKRYDATAEEHFTQDVQQSVLEEYRAEEIEGLLATWREEVSVKINDKLIDKYTS